MIEIKYLFSVCKKTSIFSLRLQQKCSFTLVNSAFCCFTSLKLNVFFAQTRVFLETLFKNLLIVLIFFNSIKSFSQNYLIDSVHNLNEVIIESNKINNFATGNRFEKIDTSISKYYNNCSIAELLSQQSNIFIKTNGLTGLATCSFRGAGAGHTAILWNGFSLQSPMNGQVDLSLIPVNIADNIHLQYGGSGALSGNGAIGGVIHLDENRQLFENKLSLGFTNKIGSYENYSEDFNFKLSNNINIISLNIFNHTGENNFTFKNIAEPGSPVKTLENSEMKQYGVIEENYFKLSDIQSLNFRFWYQNNFSDLPPTMLQDNSNSNQKDESYRISSEWQRIGNFYDCLIRSAVFLESIDYKDYLLNINALSKSQIIINEIENKFKLNSCNLLNIDLNNSNGSGKCDNYFSTKRQNQFSSVISYKFNNTENTLKISSNLRCLLIDSKLAPVIPSIGLEYKLNNSFLLNGNISKTYNVPTLNDLYWIPGGNPDLKPENGWSEEIGINYESKNFRMNFSCFNSTVSDWIAWIPDGNIWKPENVVQVWSKGIESEFKTHYNINKFKIIFSCIGSYTVSTNEKTKMENDNSSGKQLIYVPLTNAQENCMFEYCSYNFIYSQSYTGKLWITADNSEYLKSYSLGNFIIGKHFSTNHFVIELSFHINNVWNTSYQVISWVPMPTRNYQFSLKINFNK